MSATHHARGTQGNRMQLLNASTSVIATLLQTTPRGTVPVLALLAWSLSAASVHTATHADTPTTEGNLSAIDVIFTPPTGTAQPHALINTSGRSGPDVYGKQEGLGTWNTDNQTRATSDSQVVERRGW